MKKKQATTTITEPQPQVRRPGPPLDGADWELVSSWVGEENTEITLRRASESHDDLLESLVGDRFQINRTAERVVSYRVVE